MTGKVTGEHDSGTPVTIAASRAGRWSAPAWSSQFTVSSTFGRNSAEVPTIAKSCWHAVITPLRASLALSFESMKSTTTLRPATPPPPALLLRYLAPALHAVDDALEETGHERVVDVGDDGDVDLLGVTPISVAFGFSLLDCAARRDDAEGDERGDRHECGEELVRRGHGVPSERAASSGSMTRNLSILGEDRNLVSIRYLVPIRYRGGA